MEGIGEDPGLFRNAEPGEISRQQERVGMAGDGRELRSDLCAHVRPAMHVHDGGEPDHAMGSSPLGSSVAATVARLSIGAPGAMSATTASIARRTRMRLLASGLDVQRPPHPFRSSLAHDERDEPIPASSRRDSILLTVCSMRSVPSFDSALPWWIKIAEKTTKENS